MAITGNQLDLMRRMYSADIMEELQQRGSLFRPHVDIEAVSNGDSIRFQKFGQLNNAAQQTTRLEDRSYGDYTAERRIIFPTPIESAPEAIDTFDEARFITSPHTELVRAQAMDLGRYLDNMLIQAIMGNSQSEVAGVAATVALPSGQKIASSNTAFEMGTHTANLNEGKLMKAIQILRSGFVDVQLEDVTVFLNARQAAFLFSRLGTLGQLRQDFMRSTPLMDAPGIDNALSGYLGLRFIITERIPQVASEDTVLVVTRSAVKLAVWQDVRVKIFEDFRKKLDPIGIVSNMIVGAGRIYEEKVVQIQCATT